MRWFRKRAKPLTTLSQALQEGTDLPASRSTAQLVSSCHLTAKKVAAECDHINLHEMQAMGVFGIGHGAGPRKSAWPCTQDYWRWSNGPVAATAAASPCQLRGERCARLPNAQRSRYASGSGVQREKCGLDSILEARDFTLDDGAPNSGSNWPRPLLLWPFLSHPHRRMGHSAARGGDVSSGFVRHAAKPQSNHNIFLGLLCRLPVERWWQHGLVKGSVVAGGWKTTTACRREHGAHCGWQQMGGQAGKPGARAS